MGSVLTWVVAGILFLVSAIHLYWLAGGKAGALAALPSRGGEPLFRPTGWDTGGVAVVLALSGWFVLELGGAVGRVLFPNWLLGFGGWALAVVFIIRAVGEFRWVGFFKRHKGTVFAKWDTLLFSPLCLFLGVCLLYIAGR